MSEHHIPYGNVIIRALCKQCEEPVGIDMFEQGGEIVMFITPCEKCLKEGAIDLFRKTMEG